MQLPSQNLLAWQIPVTLLQVLAVGTTVFRLVHRWRSQRVWWDDYMVSTPVVLDVVYLVVLWIKFLSKADSHPILDSFWLNSLPYYTILWLVRTSLALTLARIFPPRHHARRYSIGFAISFVTIYIGALIYLSLTCKNTSHPVPKAHCWNDKYGFSAGNMTLASLDMLSDLLLIALPLHVLWHIKMPIGERRLILTLFSSSVLSLFGSLVVFVMWYGGISLGPDSEMLSLMVTHIETGLSLLSCNLLVVVMSFYHYLQSRDPNRSSDLLDSSGRNHTSPREPYSNVGSSRPMVVSSELDITFTDVCGTFPSSQLYSENVSFPSRIYIRE